MTKTSHQTIGMTGLLFGLLAVAGCSGSDAGGTAPGAGGSDTTGGTASGGAVQGNGGIPGIGGTTAGLGGNTASGGAVPATGGAANGGTKSLTGGTSPIGGNISTGGTSLGTGGAKTTGGSSSTTGGTQSTGGTQAIGGNIATGGSKATGGTPATGGTKATGGAPATGGSKATGGTPATGGAKATGGTTAAGGNSSYPCDGTTTGYNAVMTKSGSTWTVVHGTTQSYSGTDTQAALTAAFNSLTSGRTTKQSILVQGDGDIPATAQFAIPSYLILNWCGTLNVSGTPSGSDRSPLYARGKTDIDIPNLHMTGSPQYGIFFRTTNNMHLGQIDLRLTSSAGIGIRVDSSGSAATDTNFNTNLTIDYVYGTGMSSHIVETYGIDNIKIGTVEGNAVGECGLLFNRSINAQVSLVTCTDCGTGTGYARSASPIVSA